MLLLLRLFTLAHCVSTLAHWVPTLAHTLHTGQARQENARLMQTAALCHVRYFMLEKYYEQVADVAAGTPERPSAPRNPALFRVVFCPAAGFASVFTGR